VNQIMRILVIGSYKWWRMESGVERAFRRLGHETLLVDDRRLKRNIGRRLTQWWVRRAARRFKPDFVFLGKCLGLDHDTVAEVVHGRRSAIWYLDPQYFNVPDRWDVAHTVGAGKLVDTFWVTGFEDGWRRLGLRAEFLPAAADREIVPVPPRPEYASEIVFTGTGYDAGRAEFLIALSRHFKVKVWGLKWEPWRDRLDWGGRPVEEHDFAAVCSSSAISLGLIPAAARGGTTYASNRMWTTTLAGGFYLGEGTPGIDQMLLDGVHCAWFTDFDSCVAKAERYLADSAERERVRRQGETFVRAHHTFDERAQHILSGAPWVNPLEGA
jgi:hypothetical protein